MLRRCCANLAVNRVAVWGGGTMGGGIAQVTAQAGIPVTVVEVNDQFVARSRAAMVKSLERAAKKVNETDEAAQKQFVDSVLSKITFTTSVEQGAQADLVIEAVVENMEVKKQLWSKIDAVAGPNTIFATNTSSLSVTQQASVTKRGDRFGGLHFFSPVPMMKLVEVVSGDQTSPATLQTLVEYTKAIKKVPVVCKDTKGFIVNRLLIPYMLESCRLVERGVASVEDVDTAMKLGAGHPMGPFTLCDSVGVDVIKLITDAWHAAEPDNKLFEPSKLIDDKVKEGKLGRKTGEGFYKYTK